MLHKLTGNSCNLWYTQIFSTLILWSHFILFQIYQAIFCFLPYLAYHFPFGYQNTNAFSSFLLKYNTPTIDKYGRHSSHTEKSSLHSSWDFNDSKTIFGGWNFPWTNIYGWVVPFAMFMLCCWLFGVFVLTSLTPFLNKLKSLEQCDHVHH